MNHQTWIIPAERQRSKAAQSLQDLWFTLVLFWRYFIGPFVSAPPPMIAGTDPGKIAVVIVPGFICRPAIYRRLQAAIHATGHPCHILDLGYQVSSVYRKGQRLSDYITRIGAQEVYVIAHSMGGIILTTCLYQGEKRIRHGWTLGAPIWGTNIVYGVYGIALLVLLLNIGSGLGWYLLFGAFFFSAGLRQMVPGSDLLSFVSQRYDQMQNVTSVFCAMDTVVFSSLLKEPGSSSRFGRETDVLFPEAGHNNIAMGDNAIRAITAAVEAHNRTQ